MSDNPSYNSPPVRDHPGSFGQGLPARPQPSSRPSYGSNKETELPLQAEHQPTISPSYDGAGDGQGYPVHGLGNTDHDQSTVYPSVQPFFTILEDAHSSVFHHPTVHYIFSDDDTDIIKEAGFRSLETQGIAIPAETREGEFDDDHDDPTGNYQEEDKSVLPPTIPGVRTHYLLLDVEPTPSTDKVVPDVNSISTSPAGPGAVTNPLSPIAATQAAGSPGIANPVSQTPYRVTSAKSFSPSWQILNANLVPAPTFDSQDPTDGASTGIMLNIRGTGGVAKEHRSKDEGLEAMMETFEKHMAELQAVIDCAGVEHGDLENEQTREAEPEKKAEAEEVPAI